MCVCLCAASTSVAAVSAGTAAVSAGGTVTAGAVAVTTGTGGGATAATTAGTTSVAGGGGGTTAATAGTTTTGGGTATTTTTTTGGGGTENTTQSADTSTSNELDPQLISHIQFVSLTGMVGSKQSEDYKKYTRYFSWFNLLVEAPWYPQLSGSQNGNPLRDQTFLGNVFYVALCLTALYCLRRILLEYVFTRDSKHHKKVKLFSGKLMIAALGLAYLGVSLSVAHYFASGDQGNIGLFVLAVIFAVRDVFCRMFDICLCSHMTHSSSHIILPPLSMSMSMSMSITDICVCWLARCVFSGHHATHPQQQVQKTSEHQGTR